MGSASDTSVICLRIGNLCLKGKASVGLVQQRSFVVGYETYVLETQHWVSGREDTTSEVDERRVVINVEAVRALGWKVVGEQVLKLGLHAHVATESGLRVSNFLCNRSATWSEVGLNTAVVFVIIKTVVKLGSSVAVVVAGVRTHDRHGSGRTVHQRLKLRDAALITSGRHLVVMRHLDFACGRVVADYRDDEA